MISLGKNKQVVLLPEISRVKISPARIVECVSEYIFPISKNKKTSKKKKQNKNMKKVKETNEGKRTTRDR